MWYNKKTHAAIKNDWERDWSISDQPLHLFMEDILHLLIGDNLKNVLLSDIGWKGKHDLSLMNKSLRYKHADPYIPGIIAFNAPNPYNDKYRMIDGNHRIHILESQNIKESEFYFLDLKDIKTFFVDNREKNFRKTTN